MSQLNLRARDAHSYDAIVVGSGISGGWAAKELTEKGLRVLLLERGRKVEHIAGYKTAMYHPWDSAHRGEDSREVRENYPIQSQCYAFNDQTKAWWVNDKEHPYTQEKPFNWLRGYQLGGRSLMWGRQSYRLSPMDFEANQHDGAGVDWPIRYADLAPWYDYVEKFAGISGTREGLPQLPDGQFIKPMQMNCLEQHIAGAISKNWNDRRMIIGRTANLTEVKAPQRKVGRTPCRYRDRCHWGCPFGGYFSSLSATLPAALRTGRLEIVTDAIVNSVIFDDKTQRATGVRVIDANTKQWTDYFARVVFLNASTLGSTAILLNSISARFPDGLGNDSGVIGHYLMDHHFGVDATATHEGFRDQYYVGRRPNGIYVPRFRNLPGGAQRQDYVRGFGFQGSASRQGWQRGGNMEGFGAAFKDSLSQPGPWSMWLGAWGECLPYYENRVSLDRGKVDQWGQPTLKIDCEFRENEKAMRRDMAAAAAEMLEAAGMKNISVNDYLATTPPGHCIHEMGTCRMGRDPKSSALNAHNQLWAVPNVFVTDGACMTSNACQNPSLTYMALTARAAAYAVRALKRGEL